MTYPNTPGAQAHSETSRDAAAKLNASDLRTLVLDHIEIAGRYGRTGDDLSLMLGIVQGTVSARLRELELQGLIIKTKMKRKTRHKRDAFVYVHPYHYKPEMLRAPVKSDPPSDIVMMQAEHTRMKEKLRVLKSYYEALTDPINNPDVTPLVFINLVSDELVLYDPEEMKG